MIAVMIDGLRERRKIRLRMSSVEEALEFQAELGGMFVASIGRGEESIQFGLERRLECLTLLVAEFQVGVGSPRPIQERRELPQCSRV